MKKLFFVLIIIFALSPHKTFAQYTHIQGNDQFNKITDDIVSGEFSLDPVRLLQDIINDLFDEIKNSREEMVSILVIAALSGVLQIIKNSDDNTGVGEAAFFACFTIMTMSALKIFSITVGYGVSIIREISEFITKLSPVFVALLASGGAVTSAAAFHPVLSGAVYVLTLIVDKCIVPLVYLSALLGIISNMTPKLQLEALTKLIHSFGKWILTAALTVFTGVTAIYGFSVPVLDTVALKTAKFAVGSFVPVVGGLLADTVETVLGGTRLMKNAVGTAGIVLILSVSAIPILKIIAILIMLELVAAASEPLADRRITDMLKSICSSISLILGMVITSVMLFTICIGIILGSTS